eukprot:9487908-Pyramimonas_sp.AAC.1
MLAALEALPLAERLRGGTTSEGGERAPKKAPCWPQGGLPRWHCGSPGWGQHVAQCAPFLVCGSGAGPFRSRAKRDA